MRRPRQFYRFCVCRGEVVWSACLINGLAESPKQNSFVPYMWYEGYRCSQPLLSISIRSLPERQKLAKDICADTQSRIRLALVIPGTSLPHGLLQHEDKHGPVFTSNGYLHIRAGWP